MFSEREIGVIKLVTVLAISTLVIVARKKAVEDGENLRSNLAQVLCIRYLINFKKKSVAAFFDSSNKVNAVYPIFAKELDFSIRPTNVKVQKIDGITLDTYGMVVAAFLITDKAN